MDDTKSDGSLRPRARRFVLPGNSDLPSRRPHFAWYLEDVQLPLAPGASRAKGPGATERPSDAGRPQGCAPAGGA